jgi:hypothetical protein
MTRIGDLLQRVTGLEDRVQHLTTHHDEQFLVVHDETAADTCERLFNVNLRQVQRNARKPAPARPPVRRPKRRQKQRR